MLQTVFFALFFGRSQAATYTVLVGGCRTAGTGSSGVSYFDDLQCKTRCDGSDSCHGYVMGNNWCETYTADDLIGNGDTAFACLKKEAETPDPCEENTKKRHCKADAAGCVWDAGTCVSGKKETCGDYTTGKACKASENCVLDGACIPKTTPCHHIGKKGPCNQRGGCWYSGSSGCVAAV